MFKQNIAIVLLDNFLVITRKLSRDESSVLPPILLQDKKFAYVVLSFVFDTK